SRQRRKPGIGRVGFATPKRAGCKTPGTPFAFVPGTEFRSIVGRLVTHSLPLDPLLPRKHDAVKQTRRPTMFTPRTLALTIAGLRRPAKRRNPDHRGEREEH